MRDKSGNIYYNARFAAGMTQARWAEMLGVSEETVRRYEAGTITPGDDIVLSMADLSGLQILGTWHLRRKSMVAAELLPEVQRLHECTRFDDIGDIRYMAGYREVFTDFTF